MIGARFVPAGERILLATRPGFAFVFLYRQGWWLVPPIVLLLAHALAGKVLSPNPLEWFTTLAVGWILAGLVWRIIAWLSRAYILTDRRMLVIKGVITRAAGDVPLRNIQNSTMTQSAAERVLQLGTIGVATAGSDGAAINWLMVPRPREVLGSIRSAAEAPPPRAARVQTEPPVIGIAGGIGSGKSEAARVLVRLGCIAVDSDLEARQAMERPDVRARIVEWWGTSVLGPDGRVSRKALADIIFKDSEQRLRLEGLIHPLIRTKRDEVRKRAKESGAAGVVIDAPLLFEAGVDAECDAVIFVDAPREARLARVKASRGWSDEELTRREQNQMPLDEKRRRSQYVVDNSGSPQDLAKAVEAAFLSIKKRYAGAS